MNYIKLFCIKSYWDFIEEHPNIPAIEGIIFEKGKEYLSFIGHSGDYQVICDSGELFNFMPESINEYFNISLIFGRPNGNIFIDE